MDPASGVEILDEAVGFSHSTNILEKDMNPSVLQPAMSK